ncbi:MAG: M3 family oligoendopeptidase [Phototrophicaceae bacterium]
MLDTAPEQTGAESITWDLTPLYSGLDDLAIDADMQCAEALVDDFASRYRGRVSLLEADELLEAVQALEAIYDVTGRIQSYAGLVHATDTVDARTNALVAKVDEFEARVSQKFVFFQLEWNAVDETRAEALLADPALAKYRHMLEAQRRYQPYQLDEGREQLLLEKNVTGRSAWERFFSQLMGAMRYELDGEELTQSQVLVRLYSPERDVRRAAADSLTEGLRKRSMELTYIFNVLAADKATDDRLRGFPTWISSRNLSNKAPDAVVDALIEAVTARYDLVMRHYRLKRALLGLDELTDYDRYAPLPVKESDKRYVWDEARQIVLDAFNQFSDTMSESARRFFDENWIHAALAPNKRGGAFAHPVVPDVHPYVFLNYTGKARDVATLAHELGHGIHMLLSGQKSGLFGLYTPLTTAEMASVFAEMLVFSDLMEKETDPGARLAMLAAKVEDTFATVFRQVSMNRFEHGMHTARRGEGELPTERLSELWLDSQRAMFGDSVNLRDEYGLWWSYVPHFLHTPGYVYAYAFGELLVLALFDIYKEQGADFVPKYIRVLEAGDSDWPENILAEVGVDLNDPAFWSRGLNAIEALVEQEEALAREVYPDRF